MEQELFRHIETELFVPRSHLAAALELVRSTAMGRRATQGL